jgi:membrane associated rhomboid family serine protease
MAEETGRAALEVLRAAVTRRAAEDCALVLASQGIACEVRPERGRWLVCVPAAQRAAAERVLEDGEAEHLATPAETRAPAWRGGAAGPWVSVALLTFAAVTGPAADGSRWIRRGAADASALLAGEAWRALTALTLHVDAAHVIANALASALFVTWTCRSLGNGVGLAAVIASGALGNGLNALWHGGAHRSVGASTALFGALGLLAALEAGRRFGSGAPIGRSWLPLAAGLALLAMLGTGRGSDVGAHVFGLLAGGALGLPLARFAGSTRPPLQWVAGGLALAALAGAWGLALSS